MASEIFLSVNTIRKKYEWILDSACMLDVDIFHSNEAIDVEFFLWE